MSERVLAIDPGHRVGWAAGTVNPGGLVTEVTHGITELKPFAIRLLRVAPEYDVIVYENFKLRRDKALELAGSTLPTVQLIGMIRLAAWQHNVKIVDYAPTAKKTALKSLAPNLREIWDAMPTKHDDAHDGDAVLHLHHYAWSNS